MANDKQADETPKLRVPQRHLGNTGQKVSLLGLGLVKIGRNEGVKYPADFQLPSDAQVHDLLGTAHTLGITLLDTAPAYGSSEKRLGQALQNLPQFKHNCIVSSKVGEQFVNGKSTFDFSEAAIKRSIEASLNHLQRDTLDIVLLHSSGDDAAVLTEQQPLATLQQLQQEGLIGACGFSGKSLQGGRLALQLGAEVLMITLNEREREELPLVQEAQDCGAGVFIKKPISSGHGKPSVLPITAANLGVSSIVVGSLNPAHLRENALLLQNC